jgi:hypothetical protein
MATYPPVVPIERIAGAILVLRGRRVLLDTELAALYGVATERLNQQVRRNRKRFPGDFFFQLTTDEYSALILQNAGSKPGRGGRRKPPLAFTERGAIMAATVLNSPRAVEMTVYVVRAFVQMRTLLGSKRDLARKLQAVERSLLALDAKTQRQFKGVYDAILALTSEPRPKRRGIGFTADID